MSKARELADSYLDSEVDTAVADRYGKDNILGTVSQSEGVPTGAIIERGSNANGEYVKYADGTLICTKNVTFTNITTTAIAGDSGGAIRFNGSALSLGSLAATPVGGFSSYTAAVSDISLMRDIWWVCATYSSGYLFSSSNQLNPSSVNVNIIAIGRWY